VTVVIVDIEEQELPQSVITMDMTRFVFLCTDSHRRYLLRDVTKHWYAPCRNYTLLNKPVKRRFFWEALHSQGQVEESPSTAAIERIQKEFSFRRNDRPLRKHLRRQGRAGDSRRGRQGNEAGGASADQHAANEDRRGRESVHSKASTDHSGPYASGAPSPAPAERSSSVRVHRSSAPTSADPTEVMIYAARPLTADSGRRPGTRGTSPLFSRHKNKAQASSARTDGDTGALAPQGQSSFEAEKTDSGPPIVIGEAAGAAHGDQAPVADRIDSRPRILLAEDNPINVKVRTCKNVFF
jgi:hypothetical protein